MKFLREWIGQRCYWQNLNDEKKGSALMHGRFWLHRKLRKEDAKRGRRPELQVEWSMLSNFWALQLEVGSGDCNNGISLWIAFGLISLHLTLENVLPKSFIEWGYRKALGTEWMGYEYMAWPRKIGVQFFEKTFMFDVWDWDAGWDHRQPKWMSFSFCPADFILGKQEYKSEPLPGFRLGKDPWPKPAGVLMPEGVYPVTVVLTEATWKRPRWPFPLKVRRAEIECLRPIPKPGKGENSWDCDDTATYSMTCPASTVEEAVQSLRESVLRDRERHGGKGWRPKAVAA